MNLELTYLRPVIEKVVAEQLHGFLNDTSAFDPFQFVFQSGLCTKMTLVALLDNLHESCLGGNLPYWYC